MSKNNEKEILDRLQSIVDAKSKGESKSNGTVLSRINKDALTLTILVILVVISGIQTAKLSGFQSNGAGSASIQSAGTGGSGVALPSSLQNLPSQVGGC